MISYAKSMSRQAVMLKMFLATLLLLMWAASCTTAPSETPEKFVLNFIQKHIPMIDISVADFYVKEEQKGIIERVKELTASSKESAAVYDFSKIKVNVLDQKEEYVDDEAKNFMKVAAKGSYTKTLDGKSESLIEDEIIILESVGGAWKVTEKINPWK
jgi:hypothetical protein